VLRSGTRRSFSREVCELVYKAQNGYCKLCLNKIVDYHHRLPNTKTNNKLYPHFIHSIFNCYGLSRGCHLARKKEVSITPDEAMAYECWLKVYHDSP